MPRQSRLSPDRVQQVLAITCELIVEQGFDRVSVDAIAARAGASKATLYRHWSSRAGLLVAAIRAQRPQLYELPVHDTFRDDVLTALRLMAAALSKGRDMLQLLAEAGRRDDELRAESRSQIADPHAAMWATVVARWRGRPEVAGPVDLDWLPELCHTLLLSRLTPAAEPVTDDYLERFVDEVVLPAFATARAVPG